MVSEMQITKMRARMTGPENRNLRKDLSEPLLLFFFDDLGLLFPLLFFAGIDLFYYTSIAVVIIMGRRLVCS